jgi:CRISPR-associated protein Cas2
MRQVYLVTYDIRDDRRLRRIFQKMRGYGQHLQYSVFRCYLTDARKVRMISELSPLIDHKQDQILIFNLGPEDGVRTRKIEHLGQPLLAPDFGAIVV